MYGNANEYAAAEADTQFLIADFSDDELERAGECDQALNTAFCTQWWICPM